jgi:hypothetical protein
MYENIRKPALLKPIPLMWLRALPAMYYFGKYIDIDDHPRCRALFSESISYLSTVLTEFKKNQKYENISALIDRLHGISDIPQQDILAGVERFTQELSHICSVHTKQIQTHYKANKQKMIKQYQSSVTPLKVLVCGIPSDHKVHHILDTFCQYNLSFSDVHSRDYATLLAETDIVLLGDTSDTTILSVVDQMHAFNLPAVILLIFKKWESDDYLRSRHARQLIRMGIPVIYKIITPIRLFTTIDKSYMKYHLAGSIDQS